MLSGHGFVELGANTILCVKCILGIKTSPVLKVVGCFVVFTTFFTNPGTQSTVLFPILLRNVAFVTWVLFIVADVVIACVTLADMH